jgi:hypothetical protein
MTIRFLVRIPNGKYCSSSRLRCPCLGGNEDFDDCCQLFGRQLKDNATDDPGPHFKLKCIKCDACAKKVAKMKKAQP